MKRIIEPYINEYINSDYSSIFRYKLENKIYDCIRNDYKFSYNELKFICKYFYGIAIHCLKPSKDLLMANVEVNHNTIGTPGFIKKMCDEDRSLVYYIYENTEYLPECLYDYITVDDFYRKIDGETDSSKIYDEIRKSGFLLNNKKLQELKKNKEIWKIIQSEEKDTSHSSFDFLNYSFDKKPLIDYKPNDVKALDKSDHNLLKDFSIDVSTFNEENNKYIFHYVSDLHFDDKIAKHKTIFSRKEKIIEKVLSKAVSNIHKSIEAFDELPNGESCQNIILIAGDVSFDINVVERFIKKLREESNTKYVKIFYVLGNHELWDGKSGIDDAYDLNYITSKYKSMLNKYDVILLNNEIYISMYDRTDIVLSYDELKSREYKKEIEKALSNCEYVIYGGIGFAGNNEEFNTDVGIYRNLDISRDDEKELSSLHSCTLNSLLKKYKNKPLICLTHMPPKDWYDFSSDTSKCIFVSGHTHRDLYYKDSTGTYYSDNQIGYDGESYYAKQFFIDLNKKGIFVQEGIHKIKLIDYYFYFPYNKLSLLFDDELYFLCKDGIKMFVSKNKNGELSILNGGVKKKLDRKDIEYYYDNLSKVSSILIDSFDGFNKYINEVSKTVKKLGGNGKIHGCIVDIDEVFNKIYVNPFDGKITPYTAPELFSGKRTIFGNIEQLLIDTPHDTDETKRMRTKYLSNSKDYPLMLANNVSNIRIDTYSDTEDFILAYKTSRKFKKIQSLFEDGILKEWDEEFIKENEKKLSSKNDRKRIEQKNAKRKK